MSPSPIRQFFLPSINKKFFIRVSLLALSCYIIFGHLLIPLKIQGMSMEPTYRDRSFAFCWRFQYLFSPPQPFDIVAVRYAGRKVMLMKRIVAVEGETVEFRQGRLYVDGVELNEPYVKNRANWELAQRKVRPNHVYVVGDNRGTPISRHQFGEVHLKRIAGGIVP